MKVTPIVVSFTDKVPADYVVQLRELFNSLLCKKCELTEDPKVLHLWPTKDEYEKVRAQLVLWEEEGTASFLENPQ